MFQSVTVLDPNEHGDFRFTPLSDLNFAKSFRVIPLAVSEIRTLCCEFPIVFVGEENPMPNLVVGFDEERGNLLIDDEGRWKGRYLPAFLRRYPFTLVQVAGEEKGTEYAIGIDLQSGCFSDPSGEPLFNDDRTPSELLKRQITFLQTYEKEIRLSARLARTLKEKGLLTDGQITLKTDEGEKRIGGFKIVDRAKVAELDEATLAEWVRNGWYDAIVWHLLSLERFENLAHAQNR